ncbi:MAG TPA: polysaccharide biosynthesis C-terminal domain-containing protein [Pirellulales bacterium]|jgi:O-antigen/teichoic acid export membrane protein
MSLEESLIIEPAASFESSEIDLAESSEKRLRDSVNGESIKLTPVVVPATASVEVGSSDVTAGSWLERLTKTLSGGSVLRKSALALIDQGIVSGVNFLTIVLLRRTTSGSVESAEHQLGLYQLGFSILLLAACAQNSLISTPYAVFGNRLQGNERKKYAGSTLIHQGILSALIFGILLVVGGVLSTGWMESSFDGVAIALAGMIPFLLIREFVRRVAFIHLQVVSALLLDLVVAALQLGGLLALKYSGHLTAVTTFCVMGGACAVAGFAALFLLRQHFTIGRINPWHDLRLSWSFGKWSFAAQVLYLGIAYSPPWMLAIFSGTEATGRFAVGMSLVMIANPLLIGLYNYLGPQAIYALNADGLAALRRLTLRIAVIVTALVSLLYAVLILFGGTLLVAFFGAKLHGQEEVVSILALNMLAYAMSISAENGLTALNRPTAIFWSNASGLALIIVAGCFLIRSHGIVGAALSSLLGAIVAAGLKITWFYRATRDSTARN